MSAKNMPFKICVSDNLEKLSEVVNGLAFNGYVPCGGIFTFVGRPSALSEQRIGLFAIPVFRSPNARPIVPVNGTAIHVKDSPPADAAPSEPLNPATAGKP